MMFLGVLCIVYNFSLPNPLLTNGTLPEPIGALGTQAKMLAWLKQHLSRCIHAYDTQQFVPFLGELFICVKQLSPQQNFSVGA